MLKSRRGLLAAGLAVAVVGALGVASTLNAGAEQIGTGGQRPAAAEASDGAGPATPPSSLPWGSRPTQVRKGRAGENSKSLRADGLTAAANDTSGSTQPRGRYAPKGRTSRTSTLRSEQTGIRPPEPPGVSESPSADVTDTPTADPTATTEPTDAGDQTATTDPTDAPDDSATTDDAQPGEGQPGEGQPGADGSGDDQPAPTASAKSAHPEPSGVPTTSSGVDFLYSYGRQYAETDGYYTTVYIAKPKLDTKDYHTLGELALQSADGTQIVEIGWSVDRAVNGDDDPHLFVFHWVNNEPGCYNGCGFVQYSKTIKPGDTLAYGVAKKFGIQYYNGSWWVAFDTEWVGSFPESLWNDQGVKFSRSGLIQVFGEVAAATDHPCVTQMGDGNAATKAAGAYMSQVEYLNGPTVALETKATEVYPLFVISGRTFRYGGPAWVDPKDATVKYCS